MEAEKSVEERKQSSSDLASAGSQESKEETTYLLAPPTTSNSLLVATPSSKPKRKSIAAKSTRSTTSLLASSTGGILAKINKPKIILQHGHLLLDPSYGGGGGGFPKSSVMSTEVSPETDKARGCNVSSSYSSSSTCSSTSGSEFDEVNYPPVPRSSKEGIKETTKDNGPTRRASGLLTVATINSSVKRGQQYPGSSSTLKRWKGISSSSGILEDDNKIPSRTPTATTALVAAGGMLPTVILTSGEEQFDLEIDHNFGDQDEHLSALEDGSEGPPEVLGIHSSHHHHPFRQTTQEDADNEEEDDMTTGSRTGKRLVRKRNQISPCHHASDANNSGGDSGGRSQRQLASLSSSPGEDLEGEEDTTVDSSNPSTREQRRLESLAFLRYTTF